MTRQAGFTLIELLVSLTLLGLLFVLLLGGLRFGTRAWERGTAVADEGDSVRAVQNLLRREIEDACPRLLPALSPQEPPRIRFSGSAQAMSFLAPATGARGASCVPTSVKAATGVLWINGDAVLRRVQSVDIAYLPAQGAWRDGWSNQAALPALIRLRVTFPPGDHRSWPELFIAPRISADGDCTYDPTAKLCRGT